MGPAPTGMRLFGLVISLWCPSCFTMAMAAVVRPRLLNPLEEGVSAMLLVGSDEIEDVGVTGT